MTTGIIILIVFIFGSAFALMFYMNNRQKQIAAEFEGEESLKQVPAIQEELLASNLSKIKRQMNTSAIDAITECAYITSVKDKVSSAATTALKTAAWAAVGVKAKYREVDNVSYLVLSGNELHYLFFEEGEVKDHLIFGEDKLKNARPSVINNSEKIMRLSSVMQQQPNKITIDLDNNKVDILYYNEIRRDPENTLGVGKESLRTRSKLGLLGRYFKEMLAQRYPNLVA